MIPQGFFPTRPGSALTQTGSTELYNMHVHGRQKSVVSYPTAVKRATRQIQKMVRTIAPDVQVHKLIKVSTYVCSRVGYVLCCMSAVSIILLYKCLLPPIYLVRTAVIRSTICRHAFIICTAFLRTFLRSTGPIV